MKILFIGNSHTYMNDMPEIVRLNACEDIEVGMLARGGITFQDHLNDPSFSFAIKQKWDVVVIQQAAHDPCPSKEETLRDGKRMIDLIKKCGKKVYVLIPWSRKEDTVGFEVIKDIYDCLMKENDTKGIYAGYAVEKLDKYMNLYMKDHEHMNALGSYVEACCVLKAIFNQKTFQSLTVDMNHKEAFYSYKIEEQQSKLIEKVINEL